MKRARRETRFGVLATPEAFDRREHERQAVLRLGEEIGNIVERARRGDLFGPPLRLYRYVGGPRS